MKRVVRSICLPAAWLLLPVGLIMAGSAEAKDCAAFKEELVAAGNAGDIDAAERIYKEAEAANACGVDDKLILGHSTALAFFNRAIAEGTPEDQHETLLKRGLNYGRPWQVTAWVGDMELDAKRYDAAARLYGEALDDIRNEKLNPKPPGNDVIATIVKKAEEANLLSPVYVKKVDRSGGPGGLACPKYRGYTPTKTAVPIEFEYNKTDFTEKGAKAAADMLSFLKAQGSPEVHLIGHTDPKGTDSFNQKLSEDRAKATADYLAQNGYTGKIAYSGRGKKERFQPADPSRYSEAERHQMDRRVELDRKGGAAECAQSAKK